VALGGRLARALIVALRAGLFATFSLIVACLMNTRERFMGIGQVITMPKQPHSTPWRTSGFKQCGRVAVKHSFGDGH